MITREQWASAFLTEAHYPDVASNQQSIVCWIASENSNAEFNPLDTEEGGQPGETNYNGAGVKNYPTLEEGIAASLDTLHNGHYANIITALSEGAGPAFTCSFICASPWGSKPTSELVANVLADYEAYASIPIAGSEDVTAPPITIPTPIPTEDTTVTLEETIKDVDEQPTEDATGQELNAPITCGVAVPSGRGYILAAGDGGVFPFGVTYHGSIPDLVKAGTIKELNEPIVAIMAYDDNGYALVGADGGVFAFGSFQHKGSV
jgi:hypothetical protein